MEHDLGWPATTWADRNVTANRPRVEDLAPAARAALEDGCAPDRELYAHAAALLDERVRDAG
jgi:hypothetical protein